jgi:vitamin B12 transporter
MKGLFSVALILGFIPVNLYAESAVELPPMLITSEFSNVTSNISNYNDEDLKRMELSDLNGILRQESSVTVSQGSSQMTSNLSLRGAGGQGMMTIDGVPIFSDFVGVYSLQRHALDSFDSLTVTRGFSGAQQASRTLGGSIHLKTRKAITPFLHLEGGSYDSLRESMGGGLQSEWGNFSGVVGRSDIFSGVSEANTGVERDKFGATHASGNWEKVLENGKLSGSLYFVRSDQAIDNAGLLPDGKTLVG